MLASCSGSRTSPGRLHDKGLIERTKTGWAFAYRPVVAETEVVAEQVRHPFAYEHAHLVHAHRLFVIVAPLAAALDPLVWLCRGAVGFALERWADEDAASASRTSRCVTARALARAALAKLSRSRSYLVQQWTWTSRQRRGPPHRPDLRADG
ncbi:MAG: BlaI/MecI/CopY family transcriptional regulator [Acidimicrobiales bacterium]